MKHFSSFEGVWFCRERKREKGFGFEPFSIFLLKFFYPFFIFFRVFFSFHRNQLVLSGGRINLPAEFYTYNDLLTPLPATKKLTSHCTVHIEIVCNQSEREPWIIKRKEIIENIIDTITFRFCISFKSIIIRFSIFGNIFLVSQLNIK